MTTPTDPSGPTDAPVPTDPPSAGGAAAPPGVSDDSDGDRRPEPVPFPFGLVVGHDDAKLALVLAAIDPRIGGVLLRGHKGSAKTTLARGLAGLLGDAPFVELPLGATEDRLVGTLDAEAALTGGGFRFRPGLLAAAHGGVLYVDEINLLADHLVDTLLDVTVSGENVVERDGVSHRHPARFVLVGSMNPEEGELRPQLLDRFGLCVELAASSEVADRVEAVRRRLAHDGHPVDGTDLRAPLTGTGTDEPDTPTPSAVLERLLSSTSDTRSRTEGGRAAVPADVLEGASRLALAVGAEGLRADLTLCRAASALAGLEGRDTASVDDLRRVAPLALAHRSRRGPFDPPTLDPDHLRDALDDALGPPPEAPAAGAHGDVPDDPHDPSDPADVAAEDPRDADGSDDLGDRGEPDAPDDPHDRDRSDRPWEPPDRPLVLASARRVPTPPSSPTTSPRGRFVRDVPAGDGRPIAVTPTVRTLAGRRAGDPEAQLLPGDLRAEVRESPARRTIVLCVDLSGSMGARDRAEAATGTVLGLLGDAYQRRHRVALVGFRGDGAEVLLTPTSSVEVARNRLDGLATGGETPLAAGILRGLELARAASDGEGTEALLVVLTDGRATGRPDALDAAVAAATTVKAQGIPTMVLDCETGPVPLGLAAHLAEAMGARHLHAPSLDPEQFTTAIRATA